MKITALIENTGRDENYYTEHGLSLYAETSEEIILFDTGSSGNFALNAKILGKDLSAVDFAVISHGHYDHGDGLSAFFEQNAEALVYIQESAFEKHYSAKANGTKKYNGLREDYASNCRFVKVNGDRKISDKIEIFSKVRGNRLMPISNENLYVLKNEEYLQDDFCHEQNLVLREKDKLVLITGCAHKGIVNILESFKEKYKVYPTHVVGGFHLFTDNICDNKYVDILHKTGLALKGMKTTFYTCHCTGKESFESLKDLMGSSLHYLCTGEEITI